MANDPSQTTQPSVSKQAKLPGAENTKTTDVSLGTSSAMSSLIVPRMQIPNQETTLGNDAEKTPNKNSIATSPVSDLQNIKATNDANLTQFLSKLA